MLKQEKVYNINLAQKIIPRNIFWKKTALLVLAGLFGSIAAIPTLLPFIEKTAASANIPVPLVVGKQIVQSAIFMLLAVGFGLVLAGKTGLGTPILSGWLNGDAVGGKLRRLVFPSISLGLLASFTVFALDKWFFLPRMPGFSSVISQVSGWQGFLASFYGGITEEIISRLFVMTLLAWIFSLFSHTSDRKPTKMAMWIAIFGSGLIFGLGHLPATLATNQFSGLILARALLLNGIMATAFGYLYWKRGLESSMTSHFFADLLVHVVLPFFPF